MADTLNFKKGVASALPAASNGQILFTTDTNELYIDDAGSHKQINANNAKSADKLNTNAGDSNTPVYFLNGKPVACTGLDLNTSGNAATATNVAWSGVTSKPTYYDAKAIKSITRSGTTFTYTCMDGTTGTFTQQDNNTTYTSLKNPYSLTIQGNGTTLTNGTYDGSAAKTVNITPASIGAAASSHSHSYLPLSGGSMTGAILTSFKSSCAMGSYQASATTVQGLVDEIRYSSGAMGSVSIGTNYTATSGGTIGVGWYNFIYSPHRSGGASGAASGDNHQYGTLILSGMTDNFGTWVIRVSGGAIGDSRKVWKGGDSVTGAVWNDYAECRESDCEEFGYVLAENGDDTLSKTTERLQHFAGVSSDTWGFSQGETEKAKTPIAVAGRVLVYPYQDRNNYKPGDCVCSAPGGTVDIMTREEVINWPDRVVGTVSCVPNYEEWGGGEGADRDPVKVNGRIWIKVK